MATDQQRLVVCVTILCESFRQKVSQVTLQAFEWGLEGIGIDAVEAATKRALRECKWMPNPSELRELAGERKPADAAEVAWLDFLRSASLGPYRHVNFSDGVINATVRNLGGWPTIISRLSDSESEMWLRKEFVKVYTAFAARGVDGEACNPLPGLSECSVSGRTIGPPEVFLVECKSAIGTAPRITSGDKRQQERIS